MSAIHVGGTRVDYLEQGSGEPMLLLHCSASSSAQWRALAARLGQRYRVIAPDLLGYGGTAPWSGAGAFRLAHEARIVSALLGRAGAPAHLVGHSYGGAVALHIARTRPDLLASLTVIEPVAFHLLRGRDEAALAEIQSVARKALAEIVQVARSVEDALAAGDHARGIARFVDYWSGPGAWDAVPQERRGALYAGLAKIALDFHATLNEPASLADFADMAVPTLVVQGSDSPRPARLICELLAATLPDATRRVLAGAGHMAPMTHREAVAELIEAFTRAPAAPRCAPRSADGWRTGPGILTGSA